MSATTHVLKRSLLCLLVGGLLYVPLGTTSREAFADDGREPGAEPAAIERQEPDEESGTKDQGISDRDEPPATKDQVIFDDHIVVGSQCVGQDCVNGESFGFDTIRLKENNLRIKFQDTSATASFPSNDWQITINDSANGGINKFSIDDIDAGRTPFTIEAGTPSNSLYIEDSGRIGLKTSTPAVELHIADGDTPTVRLDQDGSSGWSPQIWDMAGNEANFFIRDVTNSSRLPFRIKPNAPTNSLYIKENGAIGLGTDSPVANLDVEFADTVTTNIALRVNNTDGTAGGEVFKVFTGGNAYLKGDLELGSSRDYKQNIQELSAAEALAAVTHLRPVSYNLKATPDTQSFGFIAEEVPELIATRSHRSIKPMNFVAIVTKVVQEQQSVIEQQQAMITELSQKLEELEQRMNVQEGGQ